MAPSPHDLARRFAQLAPEKRRQFLDALAAAGVDFRLLPIPVAPRPQGRAPLSYAQNRMWVAQQMGGNAALNTIAGGLRLDGPLDADALAAAFAGLSARHEALRTTFAMTADGVPEQVIHDTAPIALENMDLSGTADPQARLKALSDADATRPFDLAAGPLTRATLVRLAPETHVLLLTQHHIISDGASLSVLLRDLMTLYAARRAGTPAPLTPPALHYADFASWQRNWLGAGEMARQIEGWRARLGDGGALLALPADRPRPATQSHRGGRHAITLPAELTARLRAVTQQAGASTAMGLMAVLLALLFRLTGERDLRLGIPASNRDRPETQDLVGLLVNTLVVRAEVTGATSYRALLGTVRAAMLDAQTLQDAPFEEVVEALQPERSLARSPLLQVMHSHLVDERPARMAGLTLSPVARDTGAIAFDLVLETTEQPDGAIVAAFGYARDLFRSQSVARMAEHFLALAARCLAVPDAAIGDFPLVDAAMLDRLSAPWPGDLPLADGLVPRLIAEAARRRPDAPAVICGGETLSFAELERSANRIAHHLLRLGLGPETRVAVGLKRGPRAVAAFLGVLKAGAAFVPFDPDHPAERIADVVTDSGAVFALVDADGPALPQAVTALVPERLDLDALPDTAPEVAIHPGQLAYVIYTSGSTGRPKGVGVPHGALAMHVRATGALYGTGEDTRELHFLSFAFDGAHERWMVPLAFGGAIVLRDQGLWSAEETRDALARHHVTHAGFPPAYLTQLAEWVEGAGDPPPVTVYSFGGEAMPRAGFEAVKRALRPQVLINGYGPTEAVISPMAWRVPASESFDGPYAPIGRAVGLRRAYVLDGALQPVPIGVAGELYLGGEGLARGYLGRPGATAERFLPDPFGQSGGRMYRTGDRVRWLADGTVEYLGRADQQIKLRGFRIEPGEIEAQLRQEETVREAVVMLRTDGAAPRLVAYVTPADGAVAEEAPLRAALLRRLPDYMVPGRIVVLDAFPVTPNGKLDRAALPAPAETQDVIVAPEGETQQAVAAIWCDVLGRASVGANQNFFDLGGNSLAALRVLNALKMRFPDKTIGVPLLFSHQDVASLAAAIDADAVGTTQVVRLNPRGSRPKLYCFPGLMVNTREYAPLVRRLGPDQPVTGFVCYSLTEERKSMVSVEDIAARYAAHIRAECAGGRATLLGWSWGGVLAFEAARLLAGEVEIGFVGMLDVCNLDVNFAVGRLADIASADRARLAAQVAAWLDLAPMRAEWENLFARMDDTLFTQFLRYVETIGGDLPTDGPGLGSREYELFTFIDNTLLYRRFRMAPFDVPVRVWLAENSVARGLDLVDWSRYSPRVDQVEVIAGVTHREIVDSARFHDSFARSLAKAWDTPRAAALAGAAE
ncbi:amino acid adenylation domain-containing protein [Xanthobacter autotrophicus]|uniref:amino acid adenylation domain-containing protein n=1 Tax=Xanthobacter autotrophicus TaxID=280 RepID=UPI0037294106